MTRHVLSALLAAIALGTVSAGCASYEAEQAKNKAKEEANRLLTSVSLHTQDSRTRWRMSECSVFGRVASGQAEVNRTADSPETYSVVLPFWCEGIDLDGQYQKLKRRLSVEVSRADSSSPFAVKQYQLLPDEPLTFGAQVGGWFLGIVLFWVITFLIALWIGLSGDGQAPQVLGAIAWLASIVWVGYCAYDCFNSAWAVVICIPVYFFIQLLLMVIFTPRRQAA